MLDTAKWRNEWNAELRSIPHVETVNEYDFELTENIFLIWRFLKLYHSAIPQVRSLIDFIATKKPELLQWGDHIDSAIQRGTVKGQQLFNILVSSGKKIQSRYSKKKLSDTLQYYHIKNYIILEKINTGSVGQVHLALDKNTDMLVAAKAIDKSTVQGDEGLFQKLKDEIIVSCKMNHPYVVKTINVLETRDKIIQIMEYCDGGDLISYVRNVLYLEELSAQYFFRKILDGVKYMHINKISHRDLKPENIFLCKKILNQKEKTLIRIGKLPSCFEYELKIGDFGACCFNDAPNKVHYDIVGTLSYAAPEVLGCDKNNGYDSEKADVWSLGIILYAMLFGLLPFDNEEKDIKEAYNEIVNNKIAFPKNRVNKCSNNVKNLLIGMLNVNPINRLSLDQVINDPWVANVAKSKLEISYLNRKINVPISSTVGNQIYINKNPWNFNIYNNAALMKNSNNSTEKVLNLKNDYEKKNHNQFIEDNPVFTTSPPSNSTHTTYSSRYAIPSNAHSSNGNLINFYNIYEKRPIPLNKSNNDLYSCDNNGVLYNKVKNYDDQKVNNVTNYYTGLVNAYKNNAANINNNKGKEELSNSKLVSPKISEQSNKKNQYIYEEINYVEKDTQINDKNIYISEKSLNVIYYDQNKSIESVYLDNKNLNKNNYYNSKLVENKEYINNNYFPNKLSDSKILSDKEYKLYLNQNGIYQNNRYDTIPSENNHNNLTTNMPNNIHHEKYYLLKSSDGRIITPCYTPVNPLKAEENKRYNLFSSKKTTNEQNEYDAYNNENNISTNSKNGLQNYNQNIQNCIKKDENTTINKNNNIEIVIPQNDKGNYNNEYNYYYYDNNGKYVKCSVNYQNDPKYILSSSSSVLSKNKLNTPNNYYNNNDVHYSNYGDYKRGISEYASQSTVSYNVDDINIKNSQNHKLSNQSNLDHNSWGLNSQQNKPDKSDEIYSFKAEQNSKITIDEQEKNDMRDKMENDNEPEKREINEINNYDNSKLSSDTKNHVIDYSINFNDSRSNCSDNNICNRENKRNTYIFLKDNNICNNINNQDIKYDCYQNVNKTSSNNIIIPLMNNKIETNRKSASYSENTINTNLKPINRYTNYLNTFYEKQNTHISDNDNDNDAKNDQSDYNTKNVGYSNYEIKKTEKTNKKKHIKNSSSGSLPSSISSTSIAELSNDSSIGYINNISCKKLQGQNPKFINASKEGKTDKCEAINKCNENESNKTQHTTNSNNDNNTDTDKLNMCSTSNNAIQNDELLDVKKMNKSYKINNFAKKEIDGRNKKKEQQYSEIDRLSKNKSIDIEDDKKNNKTKKKSIENIDCIKNKRRNKGNREYFLKLKKNIYSKENISQMIFLKYCNHYYMRKNNIKIHKAFSNIKSEAKKNNSDTLKYLKKWDLYHKRRNHKNDKKGKKKKTKKHKVEIKESSFEDINMQNSDREQILKKTNKPQHIVIDSNRLSPYLYINKQNDKNMLENKINFKNNNKKEIYKDNYDVSDSFFNSNKIYYKKLKINSLYHNRCSYSDYEYSYDLCNSKIKIKEYNNHLDNIRAKIFKYDNSVYSNKTKTNNNPYSLESKNNNDIQKEGNIHYSYNNFNKRHQKEHNKKHHFKNSTNEKNIPYSYEHNKYFPLNKQNLFNENDCHDVYQNSKFIDCKKEAFSKSILTNETIPYMKRSYSLIDYKDVNIDDTFFQIKCTNKKENKYSEKKDKHEDSFNVKLSSPTKIINKIPETNLTNDIPNKTQTNNNIVSTAYIDNTSSTVQNYSHASNIYNNLNGNLNCRQVIELNDNKAGLGNETNFYILKNNGTQNYAINKITGNTSVGKYFDSNNLILSEPVFEKEYDLYQSQKITILKDTIVKNKNVTPTNYNTSQTNNYKNFIDQSNKYIQNTPNYNMNEMANNFLKSPNNYENIQKNYLNFNDLIINKNNTLSKDNLTLDQFNKTTKFIKSCNLNSDYCRNYEQNEHDTENPLQQNMEHHEGKMIYQIDKDKIIDSGKMPNNIIMHNISSIDQSNHMKSDIMTNQFSINPTAKVRRAIWKHNYDMVKDYREFKENNHNDDIKDYLTLNKTFVQYFSKTKKPNNEQKNNNKKINQNDGNSTQPMLKWINIFSRNSQKY
ncbi:serine/threonine protein kinase, putative [Plasmodium chabaudi chabaudi]|uniref:Serine/threonine protein kinase, putative n=1 Tax=Plasmodium chabaudi chabaudi TaxID=31271 RepID=A0A4V0KAV4_PLACU|nr:serine/threonine protein kinase, putative [Plasmodium chabaudi chabaudi]VTZ70034.1 serine/threonine protein kinase, putative [Plasmodium chabaudi chabaudi]|eukprot:XP_016654443.1 serine/threonine protein kinase, putative [Plasmodium chabaudi chabaudi]